MSILEVGAGIGLHTQFFLDRGCVVTLTDARDENVELMRTKYPNLTVEKLDLDTATTLAHLGHFDAVYCFGLLYHLKNPDHAITLMSDAAPVVFLETVVSPEDGDSITFVPDHQGLDSGIYSTACRPTRQWVLSRLSEKFGYSYMAVTQPNHDDFPKNWKAPNAGRYNRAIFVGSRFDLANHKLSGRCVDLHIS
jgi:hypothetical protein